MVRRNQHFQNTHKTRIALQSVLCGLVTSCGLLDNIKEVPRPADSVVLSNLPGLDAGDAAFASDASGPVATAETDETISTSGFAVTSVEHDAGHHNQTRQSAETGQHSGTTPATSNSSTQATDSSATTSSQPPASEVGPASPEDAGPTRVSDSGEESQGLTEGNSVVVLDSGLDAGGVPITKCGIPQASGTPLCDPIAQCGCEGGENCAYTPERQRRFSCVDPGETAAQDACDLDDQCTRGNVCANGLCMTTCASSDDCTNDSPCVDVPTLTGVESDIRVCTQPCDPLDADSCGQGAMCAATSGAYPTCVRKRGEAGNDEDPCTSDADCEHGLGCTQDHVCRAWCTMTVEAGLEAGAKTGECPAHSTCEPAANDLGLGQCSKPCPVPDILGSECSILPTSCGCGDGTTCHAEQLGKTVCEAPGPNGYMTWCDKNAHCAAGLSCLANLCRPVCDPELAPCTDGSACSKTLSSDASPSVCLGHCDPVTPESTSSEFTSCGTGAYCSPGFGVDTQSPESHCLRGTDAIPSTTGESCTYDTDCTNGLGCDLGAHTCAAWCATNADCEQGSCDLAGSTRTRATGELLGLCH